MKTITSTTSIDIQPSLSTGEIVEFTNEYGSTKVYEVSATVETSSIYLDETKLVKFAGYKAHPEVKGTEQTAWLTEASAGLAIPTNVIIKSRIA
jgi:hypothetical protein